MKQTIVFVRRSVVFATVITASLCSTASAQKFVDQSATGSNNGTSWTNAYTKLQDALVGSSNTEIWVAAGTYHPDEGGGQTLGSQTATFTLLNTVQLYGGFAGGETSISERNVADNETILSGDLQDDDATVGTSDNTFRVVTSSNKDNTSILDGFTLTAGIANGGGLSTNFAASKIRDCLIRGNGSATTTFGGGANINGQAFLTFLNCTFLENVAETGAGVRVHDGWVDFTNCRFIGNLADEVGGGLAITGGSTTVVNVSDCTFSGNEAFSIGGGIYREPSGFVNLRNTTLSRNRTFFNGGGGGGISTSATILVRNCVLWGNSDHTGTTLGAQLNGSSAFYNMNNSCVQGYTTGFGTNNTGSNPVLTNDDGFDAVVGTLDDNLRLYFNSPCIDTGDTSAAPLDLHDFDGDTNTTETIPLDLDMSVRVFDGDQAGGAVVDMGPYETRGCQEDLGFSGPGTIRLEICGDDLTTASSSATMLISGASSGQTLGLLVGFSVNLTSYNGGLSTLVPDFANSPGFIYQPLFANGAGELTINVPGSSNTPVTVYFQVIGDAPGANPVSNAVKAIIGS